MSDIDLTDAARAVRPYVGCCVDCPHGCGADVIDIEAMLHAALPAIREQLARQSTAAARAVSELHTPFVSAQGIEACEHCTALRQTHIIRWPCPTRKHADNAAAKHFLERGADR